jgi:hypothetical protein
VPGLRARRRFGGWSGRPDDPETSAKDRLQAIDLLFKYGLGPVTSHDVEHKFTGIFGMLSSMPADELKRLEEMDDETLSRRVHSLLTDPREAAEELK